MVSGLVDDDGCRIGVVSPPGVVDVSVPLCQGLGSTVASSPPGYPEAENVTEHLKVNNTQLTVHALSPLAVRNARVKESLPVAEGSLNAWRKEMSEVVTVMDAEQESGKHAKCLAGNGDQEHDLEQHGAAPVPGRQQVQAGELVTARANTITRSFVKANRQVTHI